MKKLKITLLAVAIFIGGLFTSNNVSTDDLLGARTSGGPQIGDKVQNGTSGSALFVDSNSDLAQDNVNFYWDDANNRFGLLYGGSLQTTLEVGGAASISGIASVSGNFSGGMANTGTSSFNFGNSSATTGSCFRIKDSDGSGYTYLRVNNGTGTFSAVDCR